jgi:hypothetical protein
MPLVTIAWREIRETLTDWRVLLPICVLTLAVPLGLVGGAGFAISFVENERLVGQWCRLRRCWWASSLPASR